MKKSRKGFESFPLWQRSGIVAVVVLALFLILNLLAKGRFFTYSNILSVLSNSVVTAFMVLGMCFIFTMGITDLSIGAIMILASNLGGVLAIDSGLGYPGLILGAVVVGVALTMLNVFLMRKAEIPPWILGLGMTMIYEAIGAIYNTSQINIGKQAVSLGNSCRALGAPPVNVILLVVAVAVAFFVYNRTSIGVGLRAVGSNIPVAKLMGVNIDRATFLAVLVGGCFIGLGAAINESFASRVVPATGLNSIASVFNPLAAFLLAKALSNVFNLTIGAAVGAFIITAIFNVLTIMGVPSGTWQQVLLGGSVLICGILSQRNFKGVSK